MGSPQTLQQGFLLPEEPAAFAAKEVDGFGGDAMSGFVLSFKFSKQLCCIQQHLLSLQGVQREASSSYALDLARAGEKALTAKASSSSSSSC